MPEGLHHSLSRPGSKQEQTSSEGGCRGFMRDIKEAVSPAGTGTIKVDVIENNYYNFPIGFLTLPHGTNELPNGGTSYTPRKGPSVQAGHNL